MNFVILSILNLIKGQTGDVIQLPNFDTSIILDKMTELQNSIGTLSIQEGPIASAHVILLAAGVVIFLGVAGEAFFKKTGIPDVAFLMILGVIIGPVFGIIQPEAVIQVVPYFAALALIIIMFDGGLNLDIKHVVKTAHFSVTLAVLGFILSVVMISLAAHFALGWAWLESILLGSIVGGSSSAIVFGLVRNIKISEETKSMLSFESALTDILATIIAFILFEAVLAGHFDIETLQETNRTSNCCRFSTWIWGRNSMDVCFNKAWKCPARIHAYSWNTVCSVFPSKFIRRIRCINCIGIWFDDRKQKSSFTSIKI